MNSSRLISALLVLFCVISLRAQLLWRVDMPGGEHPSYVFGTMHVADISFTDSLPGFASAFAEADLVVGELSLDDFRKNESNPMLMMRYAMMPADTTLQMLIGDKYFARLESLCVRELGFGAKNFEHMVPNLISSILSVKMMGVYLGIDNTTTVIDKGILESAASKGKSVEGLESLDEQLQLLFGYPLDLQAKALCEFLDDSDQTSMYELVDRYFAGDIESVARLVCANQDFGKEFVINRNRRWVDKLTPQLGKRCMFIAVGAGHLGGDFGLLELLRKQGAYVIPMYGAEVLSRNKK